jgi:hypothetical protein
VWDCAPEYSGSVDCCGDSYWHVGTEMLTAVGMNICYNLKSSSVCLLLHIGLLRTTELADYMFLRNTVGNFFPRWATVFFLICIVRGGVQTGSTRHVGHILAYCTWPGWLWGWRICWNEWQGKPKYSEKSCPDATLSTTNPTWPDPGLNPGRHGGKPATNRFSYGAA